jgi:hypothetical protein
MTKVAVLIPDVHVPHHDTQALDVVASIINDLPQLDELIFLGDIADFFSVQSHDLMPEQISLKDRLSDEVYYTNLFLDEFDKLVDPRGVKKKITIGNHSYRLARYIVKNAPQLYEYFDVESLFKLDDRGYEVHQWGRNQLCQILEANAYARHRPYNGGVNCANGSLQKKFITLVAGDTHRVQRVIRKRADKSYIECISSGCLIDFESPAFAYADTDDWAHGFTIVYQFSEDPEDYIMQFVHIKNGKAVWGGNIYEGSQDGKFNFNS